MDKPSGSTPSAALSMTSAVLADVDAKKLLVDTIASAFRLAFSDGGTFNIDTLGHLAAAVDSHKYVVNHMLGTQRFSDRIRLLEFCAKQISVEGPVLEFGVWSGTTINFLAKELPTSKIYGFDSFEGLPEAWFGKTQGIGQFDLRGEAPRVLDNVELVIGWFDRSLPAFIDSDPFEKIALLHVDCDIYSSTQTIFAHLHKKIVPGTIIVFDEYLNYPTWERHEYRAFQEYVKFRQVRYEYVGLVPSHEQVAVRILST